MTDMKSNIVTSNCRLCVTKLGEKYIFSAQNITEKEEVPLLDKIMACVSVKVLPNDNLPQKICSGCYDLVNKFYEFKNICFSSDSYLKQLFNQDISNVPKDYEKEKIFENNEQVSNCQFNFRNCGNNNNKRNNIESLEIIENHSEIKEFETKTKYKMQSFKEINLINQNSISVLNNCDKFKPFEQYVNYKEMDDNSNNKSFLDKTILITNMPGNDKTNIGSSENDFLNQDDKIICDKSREFLSTYTERKENLNFEQNVLSMVTENNVNASKNECSKIPDEDISKWNFDKEDLMLVDKCRKNRSKIFECAFCLKIFQKKQEIRRHMEIHNAIFIKKSNTTINRIIFSNQNEFLKETDKGDLNLQCKYCDKYFSDINKLIQHKKFHNSECTSRENKNLVPEEQILCYKPKIKEKGKLYLCHVCGKSCFGKYSLQCHEKIHTGEKPFACEVCGNKKFSIISNFRAHMKQHTEGKTFKCALCPSEFFTKTGLTRHEACHTGIKPFSCEMCLSKFYTLREIVRHKRFHFGDKKHVCNINLCKKSYFQRSHLIVHQRSHSGERPYLCYICSKSFTENSKLKRHLLIHDKHMSRSFCNDVKS